MLTLLTVGESSGPRQWVGRPTRSTTRAHAQKQLEDAQAELAKVEAGDSTADRWQLEQRIRHAENQLRVFGRTV